jgi:ABC-type uncharacterized transport system involved in gliding motility auxiliary subunit
MASIFIGITVLVNAISIDHYQRFDFTGVAQFTLTQKTKDVLTNLKTPVQALFFAAPQDPPDIVGYISNLLAEYQDYAGQLSLKSIDPDEHPDQARRYGVTIYPTVVFESGQHRRAVPWSKIIVPYGQEYAMEAEHVFTSAILEVTGTVQKKVYFLAGHGEADINSDYSRARDALLDNLYKVQTLDLAISPGIPEDAAAIVIAGPQRSLARDEIEMIQNYLKDNGQGLILINPGFPRQINDLLSAWDIRIEEGTIVDPSSYAAPAIDSPMVPKIRNFFALSNTYFPGATAIIPKEGYTPKLMITGTGGIPQVLWTSEDSQIQMLSVVRTSQDSWLEKNFDPLKEPHFDQETEFKGPLNIGFFITSLPIDETKREKMKTVERSRLAIFGDSDFASNKHFSNTANGDLFLNAVNWITAGTELIRIERQVVPFRRLVGGPETIHFIRISSIVLLPLMVLIAGIVIWWRRR